MVISSAVSDTASERPASFRKPNRFVSNRSVRPLCDQALTAGLPIANVIERTEVPSVRAGVVAFSGKLHEKFIRKIVDSVTVCVTYHRCGLMISI